MKKMIYNQIKKIIPKLSETELIALRSGKTVQSTIDRDIFRGKVCKNKLLKDKPNKLNELEKKLLKETDVLLEGIGQENMYPNDNIKEILSRLGDRKFFSFNIDKKYGGCNISYSAQTRLLTKISSYNPSLGVIVMVPNSLGPSELLQHYGTEGQKNKYLYNLASGKFIPCFALTGPHNGSDAAGQIDIGVVKEEKGERWIEITLNKRYITLAPVSNLIGIAFNLKDPKHILKGSGKEGVTVALIEKGHDGLEQNTYHNPNNAGFPNGTIKGKIKIDMNAIIGGEDNAGNGWKMLMECLSIGRGISLPSSANGSSKLLTYGIYHYIRHRRQFKIPIGQMEGVKEKFIEMFYQSFIIECSVTYIGHIMDKKIFSPVLSAIMKQQTTERSRQVLNLGMDIYAGSGICIGENNFFTKFYHSSPVGITVEGSNTLTRSLIIFGQGLNQSHPFIYDIFQSIQDNDPVKFNLLFNKMLKHVILNYFKSIGNLSNDRLSLITIKFSNLSNFIALLGGKIRSKQMLSGYMADILSNIFLAHCVLWYFHHNIEISNTHSLKIQNFLIDRLCQESEYKINMIISNYPNYYLSLFLSPTRANHSFNSIEEINDIYSIINKDPIFMDQLKKDLFFKDTIVEKLEKLSSLNPLNPEDKYIDLYEQIIQVGENKITS